jgi:tetratricopeptide (TPR) repeat protein
MDGKQRRAAPAKNGRVAIPSGIWSGQCRSARPASPARDSASIARDDGPVAEGAAADSVLAAFSRALKVQQSGGGDEAIVIYGRILAGNPNLPEVHCNLGAALAGLGRLQEAESSLRQAISLNPDYPEPHGNLGMALKSLGRLDEAAAALRRAIALRPRWPEVLSKLGITLYEMGRLEEAEPVLHQAIALKPGFAEAQAYLAMTLKKLRRPDEAEIAFRDAIALKPESAELHVNLGVVLTTLGRTQEAVPLYRRAIALEPGLAQAYNNLGTALRTLGAPDEAEAALRRAIALRPDFAKAYNNLGNVLLDLERPDEAVAAYREAIALRPGYSEAYNNLGLALKELGHLPQARRATEQAIRLAPRQAAYFRNLGDLRRFVAGEAHLTAMEELAQDAASLPVQDQINLHFALAKAYEDLGQCENSFRQLLAGNALKRRQIAYDEATVLDGLERVAAAFTPELIRARQGAGERSAVPVFIVGMLRSGTTLLEQILASHPQVLGAGELKLLGNAATRIRPRDGGAAEFPDVVCEMSAEQINAFGADYVAELRRRAPDAARIINKMPSNYILAGLIHLALPNAAIIHAVRDGADTCVSCFSKLFTEEQNHTYDLAELGRYYRGYEALMAHWRRVLPPGRILDVRYEDVVADLEGAARRMVAHCGLPWDPRCLAFHQTERPVRTASAIQVRQPLYAGAVGRWRQYEPLLGPLLAELRREAVGS